VLFIAVFLHKFLKASPCQRDARRGQGRARATPHCSWRTTVLGVLAINLEPGWVKAGLPLSAGVTIYVAATDLVPK